MIVISLILLTLSQVSAWCVTTHEDFFSDSLCANKIANTKITKSYDKGCRKLSYASSWKVKCTAMKSIEYSIFANEDCFGYRASDRYVPYQTCVQKYGSTTEWQRTYCDVIDEECEDPALATGANFVQMSYIMFSIISLSIIGF